MSDLATLGLGAIASILVLFQGVGLMILLSRLLKGAIRLPPLEPILSQSRDFARVTVVVPTLNEANRIDPCLQGLSEQGHELREVIVVDSRSQDGTPERVIAIAKSDPRFRVMTDDPLPSHWVGRPWALHTGYLASSEESEWILGIDADTQPQPGLIASLLRAAEAGDWDLLTLSPQFILRYPGEWWLQPALLMTLLYRFEVAGVRAQIPGQVMANGQCFFCRRSVLAKLGGYQAAAQSFCDDVTLARYAAQQGFKVGFLDGAKVIRVRMYEGAVETWREWGRSLDLKDACTRSQLWGDLAILFVTQGLPLFVLIGLGWAVSLGADFLSVQIAIAINLFLLTLRFALLFAIYPSYYRSGASYPTCWLFWLSPLADPLAVLRIFLSATHRPKQWRGRSYAA